MTCSLPHYKLSKLNAVAQNHAATAAISQPLESDSLEALGHLHVSTSSSLLVRLLYLILASMQRAVPLLAAWVI
jgi:hypothetical protein